jgi:transcriptional regulator with XRE-family HTH domain
MSLYNRLLKTSKGGRALASARLRYEVLSLLHRALQQAWINQSELAARLGVRKSAVSQVLRGDGNMRISTFAEYLHALGCEV